MTWTAVGLSVLGGLSALSAALWAVDTCRRAWRYRQKVGLDLPGLIALLPEELRGRPYYGFRLAPGQRERISVGLCYRDGVLRRGNPPNVGLDFDPETGALRAIHPEGIGLGLA